MGLTLALRDMFHVTSKTHMSSDKHYAQAVTMIIISFFNDVSNVIIDLSVKNINLNTNLFTKILKNGTLKKRLVLYAAFTT